MQFISLVKAKYSASLLQSSIILLLLVVVVVELSIVKTVEYLFSGLFDEYKHPNISIFGSKKAFRT